MKRETFALSQKEPQRVAVVSRYVKGELACARAAGLLCLSLRQIKRLKKRLREDGEAALAHANRGQHSHRRLPDAVRERVVRLARSTNEKAEQFCSAFAVLKSCSGSEVTGRDAALLQVLLVILFGAIESACRCNLCRDGPF